MVRCSACCRPSRTWITFKTFSATFEASVPHFYLCRTHCIIPESFLNHPNRFCGGMFKLNEKSDADSLLYLLSHFECNGHTVHMLIQWHLLPPLTSTVMSSLFTHVHSNPLSLAAMLHQFHVTHKPFSWFLTMVGFFSDIPDIVFEGLLSFSFFNIFTHIFNPECIYVRNLVCSRN